MGSYRPCRVCGETVQGFKHRYCEFPVVKGRGGGTSSPMHRLNNRAKRRKDKDMRLKENREAPVS